MRRPLALALACPLLVAFLGVREGRALGQEPLLRLTLLQQTPQWNDADHPSVTIRVRARNIGQEAFDDLSIGITLWAPVFSRTGFEESLVSDPADAAALLAETRPREGTLSPGETRDFEIPIDLPLEQLSSTQSLVYPLKIDVRSGYRSIAAIRTPVIYVVRTPEHPLTFSWTFVLHAQLSIRPDGVFTSPAFETSISRGGRLAAEIAVLSTLAGGPVGLDVAVSPVLLLQLAQMRDGYRVVDGAKVRTVAAGDGASATAAETLERLRSIADAPNVELSSLPYAEPLLPALASGDLGHDLGVQLEQGRELVDAMLGRTPSSTVVRPPRSAVDDATLDGLAAHGVSTLLLDPAVVPRTEDAQGFAPSPIVSIAAQSASLTGVVADPAVQAMLSSELVLDDPVLASQAMLGELASIWLQRPGEPHALSMILGEDVAPPAAFFSPLARGIAGAPWLAKRTATGLLTEPDVPRFSGTAQPVASEQLFSPTYVDELKRARRSVKTLRTMLVRPSDQPAHLDELLLLAESQRFVEDEASGMAFVHRVRDSVAATFGAISPQVSQPITLTSSAIHGVPIAVENSADVPLRVTIRLDSPNLRGPVEATSVLPANSTLTVPMDLELKTTGRFLVPMQILSPSGVVVGRTSVIVRSTTYNRVALVITFGAALLAVLVWARRFLPRRTG